MQQTKSMNENLNLLVIFLENNNLNNCSKYMKLILIAKAYYKTILITKKFESIFQL